MFSTHDTLDAYKQIPAYYISLSLHSVKENGKIADICMDHFWPGIAHS